MRFVILTGLSGAGKATGLAALEDIGYFTADNLPPMLWGELLAQARGASGKTAQDKVVVGIDVRTRDFLSDVPHALEQLRAQGITAEVIFLDASDEVLVKRYNLTRRTHPLGQAPLGSDIAQEREVLGGLRALADFVLDTSHFSARELTEELWTRFGDERRFRLRLVSFGFKRGAPIDADNIFDLRSLPNPYYDPALRPLDGRDERVKNYVFTNEGLAFYTELREFVRLLASRAVSAGRSSYTVALGCTGGQHRSVALTERLTRDLAETFATYADHRDVVVALAEHGHKTGPSSEETLEQDSAREDAGDTHGAT